MDDANRSRCLAYLRDASACLEGSPYAVVAVRLQDIIETIEQDVAKDAVRLSSTED